MLRIRTLTVPVLASALLLAACGGDTPDGQAPEAGAAAVSEPGVVEVVARGLELEAPAEIPSGWTTFRFANESSMVHFVMVERLPEGRTLADQQAEVAPPFQEGLDLLMGGDVDAAMTRFGELPEWFGEIVFMGGPGLTGPGRTSEASVFLEPGTYLLECYVKTDGVFHSFNPDPDAFGMMHEFTVTGAPSGAAEPAPTVRLSISTAEGIVPDRDVLSAGRHTFGVEFVDQTVHENFVGHDVHLLQMADDTDPEAVSEWMNWSLPGGLETPAPVPFLGGINDMPPGTTGYFTVDLDPGRYALVSEVADPLSKGMLRVFTVEAQAAARE